MDSLSHLKVKIFADGANLIDMMRWYSNPLIKGFTTNPTLMRQAGVADYVAFAKSIVTAIPDRPISFEVFSDRFDEMEEQAIEIGRWGRNVFVKIPVMNTQGEESSYLVRRLSRRGIQVNVTAATTLEQVLDFAPCLADGRASYISLFAGRVADTGRDPIPLVTSAVKVLKAYPNIELIWASPRELLNIFQADAAGCQIITMTHDLLTKLVLVGKDLKEYSLDTVKMFYEDARKAGYRLEAQALGAATSARC